MSAPAHAQATKVIFFVQDHPGKMPQEMNVLSCYSCEIFQVHIVKKSKRWQCKICGEKQSIKKVYFRGSGKDCRGHVQKLNFSKHAREQSELEELEDIDFDAVEDDFTENNRRDLDEIKTADSKWTKYSDGPSNDQNRDDGEGNISKSKNKLSKNTSISKNECFTSDDTSHENNSSIHEIETNSCRVEPFAKNFKRIKLSVPAENASSGGFERVPSPTSDNVSVVENNSLECSSRKIDLFDLIKNGLPYSSERNSGVDNYEDNQSSTSLNNQTFLTNENRLCEKKLPLCQQLSSCSKEDHKISDVNLLTENEMRSDKNIPEEYLPEVEPFSESLKKDVVPAVRESKWVKYVNVTEPSQDSNSDSDNENDLSNNDLNFERRQEELQYRIQEIDESLDRSSKNVQDKIFQSSESADIKSKSLENKLDVISKCVKKSMPKMGNIFETHCNDLDEILNF